MSAPIDRKYRPETRMVHAGSLRSQFGEMSEALFLTQGYVYETALTAEKRFTNELPGYQYSRFSNPTVTMFEQRMASLEGAQAARATATGMAAVTTAAHGPGAGGRPCGRRQGDFRFLPLRGRGPICRATAFRPRWSTAAISIKWRKAVRPNTKTFFLESPTNPTLDVLDIKAIADIAHEAGATLWSTMFFRRRSISIRSNSAPTAWSIPQPNISTAKAAASAASSWVRKNSSRTISTN